MTTAVSCSRLQSRAPPGVDKEQLQAGTSIYQSIYLESVQIIIFLLHCQIMTLSYECRRLLLPDLMFLSLRVKIQLPHSLLPLHSQGSRGCWESIQAVLLQMWGCTMDKSSVQSENMKRTWVKIHFTFFPSIILDSSKTIFTFFLSRIAKRNRTILLYRQSDGHTHTHHNSQLHKENNKQGCGWRQSSTDWNLILKPKLYFGATTSNKNLFHVSLFQWQQYSTDSLT